MKQPRRWAVVLTALLMAASLVITPREVGARGGPSRPIDTTDPPMQEYGDPDVPDGSPRLVFGSAEWAVVLAVARYAIVVQLMPSVCASRQTTVTIHLRVTERSR